MSDAISATLISVPVEQLMPDPTQPRKTFEISALERLADSIKARGVQTPLRVMHDAQRGCYVIVTGESRWRAAKMARLTHVPCLLVTGSLPEADLLADRLTENMVRQDLSPIEEAAALVKLKTLKGCTAKELTKEYGFSGAAFSRAEALLSLPAELQALVGPGKGQIPESAAYELSRLPDDATKLELAQAITSGKLTRDRTAQAVRERIGKRNVQPRKGRLAVKLDGGISLTLSSAADLTAEAVKAVIEQLKLEARKLENPAPATASDL